MTAWLFCQIQVHGASAKLTQDYQQSAPSIQSINTNYFRSAFKYSVNQSQLNIAYNSPGMPKTHKIAFQATNVTAQSISKTGIRFQHPKLDD
jgi:hypothetical protein